MALLSPQDTNTKARNILSPSGSLWFSIALLGFENMHTQRSCRALRKGSNDLVCTQGTDRKKAAVDLQSRGARDRNGRLIKIKAVRWGRPEEAENMKQHHNFCYLLL